MRQRFLTALHAFRVIMNGEYHVFQSEKYTSAKGTKKTVDTAIGKFKTFEWDGETQIRGYWEVIIKPKV